MKKALITGGMGFVGRHLTRRLCADGWQVAALERPKTPRLRFKGLRCHDYDGTSRGMIRLLQAAKPDVVFHLAALYVSEHGPDDIRPLIESNVLLGCQLAEAMAQSGTRLLVNTGTSWQHFQDAPYDPVNLYAATKQACEDVLAYYQEARGLKTIHLQLFDTYGPDDARPKLLAALRRAAEQEVAFSAGRQFIDLVHIDDVVEAFVQAGRRLLSGKVRKSETYAVSSGRPQTLRAVTGLFEKALGRPLKIRWGERPYRFREVMRPWSQGRRLPGWRPRISLEKGFSSLLRNSR